MAIAERDIGSAVVCKTCHRVLTPVPVSRAGDSTLAALATAEVRPFKNCPFCAERILESAKKCRHCGEYFGGSSDENADGKPSAANPASMDEATGGEDKIQFAFCVSTSQWDNFFKYIVCLIVAILAASVYVIPSLRPYAGIIFGSVLMVDLIVVFLIYFGTRASRCFVGPERVELHAGVFTRQIDWISLASIQDMQLRQGFIQRSLKIGTIIIKSMDETTPVMELYQISKAHKIFSYIQEQVARIKRAPRWGPTSRHHAP
jgi:membrane protein YdbS with pleckstrin-like domain